MTDHTPRDKVEEEKKEPEFKKTPEYHKFKKLLKRVVKAPPLPRRIKVQSPDATETG
jgi:hypothetical protein